MRAARGSPRTAAGSTAPGRASPAASTRSSTASSSTTTSPPRWPAAARSSSRPWRSSARGQSFGATTTIERFAGADGQERSPTGASGPRNRSGSPTQAGVRIATGTDFGGGSTRANQLAWEVESLVAAGLEPWEALAPRRGAAASSSASPTPACSARAGRPTSSSSTATRCRIPRRSGGSGASPGRQIRSPSSLADGHPDPPRRALDLGRPERRHGALDRDLAPRRVGSVGLYSSVVTTAPGRARPASTTTASARRRIWIASGRARYTFGPTGVEETLDAEPGDFVYIPAGEVHVEENASDTEPLVVVISRNCPGSVVHYLDEGDGRSRRRLADSIARRPPGRARPDRSARARVPDRRLVRRAVHVDRAAGRPSRNGSSSSGRHRAIDWIAAATADTTIREARLASLARRVSPDPALPRRRGRRRRGGHPDARPLERAPRVGATGPCLGRYRRRRRRPRPRPPRRTSCRPVVVDDRPAAYATPEQPGFPWCPLPERLTLTARPTCGRHIARGIPAGVESAGKLLTGWDAFERHALRPARDLDGGSGRDPARSSRRSAGCRPSGCTAT